MILQRTVLLLLVGVSIASAANPAPSEILAAVSRYVPSASAVAPPKDVAAFFSGHYSRSPELERQFPGGFLSGDHLYLFPDQSYVYTEWADVLPETILDKGIWSFGEGYIKLQSDGSVPQKHTRHDRTLVPLTVEVGGNRQLFVLGLPFGYRYFREFTETGGDLKFHFSARARIADFPAPDATAAKARLMKESWRPEWFGK